jgi:hypothetical protein
VSSSEIAAAVGLMLLGALLFVVLPAWIIYRMFKKQPPKFCTSCGHEGSPRVVTRGSIAIEIVAWLCFLVPGLIYSLWRQGSRHSACAACSATTLVPTESPVARATKKRLSGAS